MEGVTIYAGVLFISLFAAGNDYMREKQNLRLIDEILNEEVNVIRGYSGLSMPCKVVDLVVGDIVMIETGMRVPADCILLRGMDVKVDEGLYHEGRSTIV